MKMDHATFASHRDAFLDGRLTEDESRLVERHLAECPTCQAAIDHLLAADTHLREQPDPEWTERLSICTGSNHRPLGPARLVLATGHRGRLDLAIGLGLMLLRPPQSSTPTRRPWVLPTCTMDEIHAGPPP